MSRHSSIEVDPAVVYDILPHDPYHATPASPSHRTGDSPLIHWHAGHWHGQLENTSQSDYASAGYNTNNPESLSASIQEFFFENGRQYHAYYGVDKNPLPTDQVEQERMDLHHEIMVLLLDGALHTAPLYNPQRILDVGTGTGIWAVEMAVRYPQARVVGMDLSLPRPKWAPPNCVFETDDAERKWPYPPGFFDFIHCRNVGQSIVDWPNLLSQAYYTLEPGAYIELAEQGGELLCDDGTMAEDHATLIFYKLLAQALERMGRPPHITGQMLVSQLNAAGFVDVHLTEVKLPYGPWPREPTLKHIGAMALQGAQSGFNAYGMAAFTRVLGLGRQVAEKICQASFDAVQNKNAHTYSKFYVAHGRKPGP